MKNKIKEVKKVIPKDKDLSKKELDSLVVATDNSFDLRKSALLDSLRAERERWPQQQFWNE